MAELLPFPETRPSGPESSELDRRRRALERRLDDGYERIEQAVATGADVSTWEVFWIDLLREYEAVCDELRQAA